MTSYIEGKSVPRTGAMEKLRKDFSVFWYRFSQNKLGVVGLAIILFIISLGILTPFIAPFPPLRTGTGDPFESPNSEHLFGTDNLGRDILSEILWGSRTALLVGISTMLTSVAIGVLIGALAGYYGGRIDDLLTGITTIFQVLPSLVLALVFVAVFGSDLWIVIIVISMVSWPSTARLMRTEVMSLKERDFVLAARSIGFNDRKIIFSEIMPNAIPPIVVNASVRVAVAILIEAGLSFLGLSDPHVSSWGRMISNAKRFLQISWEMSIFPGSALAITALGWNLLGEGMNDALNPKRAQI